MKKVLTFQELEECIPVVSQEKMEKLTGGVDFYYYLDGSGNYQVSFDNGQTWTATSASYLVQMDQSYYGAYGTPSSISSSYGSGGSTAGGGPSYTYGGYNGGSTSTGSGSTSGNGPSGSYGGSTGSGSTSGGGSSGGGTGTSSGDPSGTYGGVYGGVYGGTPGSTSGSGTSSAGSTGSVVGNEILGLSQNDVSNILLGGFLATGVEGSLATELVAIIAPEVLAGVAAGIALAVIVSALHANNTTQYWTERGVPFVEPPNIYNNLDGNGMAPFPGGGNFGAALFAFCAATGAVWLYNTMAPYYGWPPIDPFTNPPAPDPAPNGQNPGYYPTDPFGNTIFPVAPVQGLTPQG